MTRADYVRRRRQLTNVVMLGLTGVATVLTVSVLFFILGYLVYKGGSSLSFAFFTRLPAPVGEAGGGMANAILGTGKLLLIATITGAPIGFLAGVYVAEFASPVMAFTLRYAMIHMIQETARHCGHLDLLRESTDGVVGM